MTDTTMIVKHSSAPDDAEWEDLLTAAARWGMMNRKDSDPRTPSIGPTYTAILQQLRDAGDTPVSAISLFGDNFWGAGHERLNAVLKRNQTSFRVKFTDSGKPGEDRRSKTLSLVRV